jgi:tRNA-modifying protein YgfZ
MNPGVRARLEAAGARLVEIGGRVVARDLGDPAAEYAALRESAGVVVRSDLVPVRMWGKDPRRMLHGLVTNDLLSLPPGRGAYAAMLTPKGRVISDLRALPRSGEPAELLVLLPAAAADAAMQQLKKFVPPMFARWGDVSGELSVLGVYGPRAAEVVESALALPSLPRVEDALLETDHAGAPVLVVASGEAGGEPGWELVVGAGEAAALHELLLAAARAVGGRAAGWSALEVARIEGGRPRGGAELTEETIPTEAYEAIGWMPRAISFTKGCYTGQEVVVRIAHRGHVNRHLRGLRLGDAPVPAPGTPLRHPTTGKEVGRVTSAASSPLVGETIALAFVRRELTAGDEVVIGDAGNRARVAELPFSRAG